MANYFDPKCYYSSGTIWSLFGMHNIACHHPDIFNDVTQTLHVDSIHGYDNCVPIPFKYDDNKPTIECSQCSLKHLHNIA